MKKIDYLFGMNYIDQFQSEVARQCGERCEHIIPGYSLQPINTALTWVDTAQGHQVWSKRERIFDLYYGIALMNLDQIPRDAVTLNDEPLLVGFAPTNRDDNEVDAPFPLF